MPTGRRGGEGYVSHIIGCILQSYFPILFTILIFDYAMLKRIECLSRIECLNTEAQRTHL